MQNTTTLPKNISKGRLLGWYAALLLGTIYMVKNDVLYEKALRESAEAGLQTILKSAVRNGCNDSDFRNQETIYDAGDRFAISEYIMTLLPGIPSRTKTLKTDKVEINGITNLKSTAKEITIKLTGTDTGSGHRYETTVPTNYVACIKRLTIG